MLQRPPPLAALRAEGFDALLALGQADDSESLHRTALAVIRSVCGAERASILLLDDANVARFVASHGLSERYRRAVEGHFPWAVDDPEPGSIVVSDVLADPSLAEYHELMREEGIRALAFIPLVAEGRLLGKFMLYSDVERSFAPDELMVIERLASHLAASMLRVRQGELRSHQLVRERTLRRLLEISLENVELDGQLQRALEVVLEGSSVHGAPGGVLFLAEPDGGLRQVAASGVGSEITEGCARVALGHCLCGRVALSQTYLTSAHVDELHTEGGPEMADHGHRVVPILARGELLGVLNCYVPAGHVGSASDRHFLEASCKVLAGMIERRRAQETLDRASRDLRGIIQHAPEGIAIHRGGRFVLTNPVVEDVLGYEPGELLGAPVMQVIAAADRPLVAERVRRLTEASELAPPQLERMIRKDGSEVMVEVVAVPIDFEGERSVLAMARDVDERERLAAKALEADRLIALGTLAAGVGHEINNPLTYVSANLDFALEALRGEGDPEVVEALEEAHEGAARIAAIVKDLKAMTRSSVAMGPVDVGALIGRAERVLAKHVASCGALVVEHEARHMVRGDAGRLGQVLLNLVVNAAQACGDGSDHRIAVRSRDEGARVRLEVEDDGVGIEPEIVGKIYDPFFTTKPVGQGTGLGLSICRRIVEEHAGEMRIDSKPGVGTKVSVWLPAVVGESPDGASGAARPAPGGAKP